MHAQMKIQFHSRVGPIVACNPPQSLVYVHIRGSLTVCKCQIGGNATSNGSLFAAMYTTTEDGSTDVVPQILYVPYLILGVFGSRMF